MLKTYFRSGWAFFIPYLAAYLLYAWLRWPVNPVVEGAGSREQGAGGWVPCLLHVYWTLHAMHLVLGTIAMRFWLRHASLLHSPLSLLLKAAPWLLLALLFYIPGIYLEWPSDPWEHLRRINEWRILDQVTAHSSWKKSSYFLPYSLTQHVTGLTQLSWLNFYYTAVCLLLSWQYYRLARAVGLSDRASFVFVLLNALTFGNNIFSFYRYYGLSSSILAQIGAVALTRLALEAARGNAGQGAMESGRRPFLPSPFFLLTSALCLTALTAFNHIQGIGIAGLGILAVLVWRLIEWKRSMVFWLGAAAMAASIAVVLWFPRHPALDEIYRPQGWLTGWYGFNFYSPLSPALERSLQILGGFGVLNLIFAVLLVLRRNHVAGWLILMPVAVLALPCFALPFTHVLTLKASTEHLHIFHRLLLSSPAGLALIIVTPRLLSGHFRERKPAPPAIQAMSAWRGQYGFVLASVTLLLGLCLPHGGSLSYNRFWHAMGVTPSDLNLQPIVADWTPARLRATNDKDTLTISHPLHTQVKAALATDSAWISWREIWTPLNTRELTRTFNWVRTFVAGDFSANEPTVRPPTSGLHRRIATAQNPSTASVIELSRFGVAWLNLGGEPPDLLTSGTSLLVSNPSGKASHTFAAELIPLDRRKRYALAIRVRQFGATATVNYLAVAWYSMNRQHLVSSDPAPNGAGDPLGWHNGTFSYFGLIAQTAPKEPTSYTVTFGLGEAAEIPANAAFMRVGALLNYNWTPDTRIQISDVVLREKKSPEHLFLPSSFKYSLYTPFSYAARLTGHWPSIRVHIDSAGADELHTAISAALNP